MPMTTRWSLDAHQCSIKCWRYNSANRCPWCCSQTRDKHPFIFPCIRKCQSQLNSSKLGYSTYFHDVSYLLMTFYIWLQIIIVYWCWFENTYVVALVVATLIHLIACWRLIDSTPLLLNQQCMLECCVQKSLSVCDTVYVCLCVCARACVCVCVCVTLCVCVRGGGGLALPGTALLAVPILVLAVSHSISLDRSLAGFFPTAPPHAAGSRCISYLAVQICGCAAANFAS